MSLSEVKSKMPMFDGKAESFDCWKIQWNAFTEVDNITEALGTKLNTDMPQNSKHVLNPVEDKDKKIIVARKANKQAMAYYALVFKTMKLLRLITKAKTDEWPGGEAWRVKKALMAKYRPGDVLTVSELKKRLNVVALKGNQDPSDMFEELAAIEHAYVETKAALGSQDLSGAVFAAAPEKYHSVLTITAELKGANLDIDHLESAMYKLWIQGGGKPRGNEDNNKIVLSAFAGTCYLCKSQGHKATDCPKKNKSSGGGRGSGRGGGGGHGYQGRGKFMGSCNQCGKFGHRKGDCWEIESNRQKRPERYRSTEQANVTLDRNDDDNDIEFVICGLCLLADKDNDIHDKVTLHHIVLTDEYADVILTEIALIDKQTDRDANIDKGEIVLVDMEFPDSMRLLNDPKIWSEDAAAIGHTSPYQHGMTPEGNTVKNGSITVGNGITKRTAMYRNISGTICNKQGTN
jgi:hypothetical protein